MERFRPDLPRFGKNGSAMKLYIQNEEKASIRVILCAVLPLCLFVCLFINHEQSKDTNNNTYFQPTAACC
jgi:hypothetical protein